MTAILAAGQVPTFLPGLAALVVAAAGIAYISTRFHQVPIVGFLLAGVIIGPYALGFVDSPEAIEQEAEIGVILLLFTIGIEFSLERLGQIRRLIVVGGGLQVSMAIGVTVAVLTLFGVAAPVAVYTGFLVALSSTVIVLKLLGDRGETNSPTGQTAVGLLIFQDLAIIVMVLLTPMLGGEGGSAGDIAIALAQALGIIALVIVGARRLMPRLLDAVAKTCSQEIFLLVVIAVCIGTAYITSLAGVSVSLGAFLAGLLVSESRFNLQALGEVLPLQILFSAVFFVSVGMLLDLSFLFRNVPLILAAVAAVLIIKIATTAIAVRLLGRPWPVVAAAALTLAQVGEFSFVLEGVGREAGLSPAGLGESGSQVFIATTVVLMVATPALSRLGAIAGHQVAARMRSTGLTVGGDMSANGHPLIGHVIIAGYGHAGKTLADVLERSHIDYVITTLSPDGATEAEARGRRVLVGDARRRQTLESAGLAEALMMVVADDDPETARGVLATARVMRPDVDVLVRIAEGDEQELLDAGAREVITQEEASALAVSVHVLRRYGLANAAIAEEIDRSSDRPGAWPAAVTSARLTRVDERQRVEFAADPDAKCTHIDGVQPIMPSASGCEDCLRMGASWVHLRICMSCGHVGCCDSSPHRHAHRHFDQTTHPVMRSIEPSEEWGWCFADEVRL